MNIWFNVKEAYNQLLTCGYVYTLRNTRNYQYICTAKSSLPGKVIDIGRVTVKKVCEINGNNRGKLNDYLRGSGFKKVDDWWSIANNINQDSNLTLYLVEIAK